MTDLEFQEAIKIHIVTGRTIKDISKAWGLKKHIIPDRMRKLGIKANRVCLTPSKGYSYCSKCKQVLTEDNFRNHHWCKSCQNLNEKKRLRDPRQCRNRSYLRRVSDLSLKYKLTEQTFRDMQDMQKGCCKICGDSLEKIYVDHCHTTGKVRGLLCNHCNTGLGQFKDNIASLNRAIEYLEDYNE